jgi:ATP-dependent Lhr-like helicase
VEPVVAPPEPRHLVAQQLLALCLQEHHVGENLWHEWWGGVGPFGPGAAPVVRHLVEQGYLDRDGGLLFMGPEAERRYGYRHFMNLTAVFTAPPEFTVFKGRTEIGRTDPDLLTERIDGPRKLLLAGRSWLVTYIDWNRKRCFVEPVDEGGRARWSGFGAERIRSFTLARAARDVLLGEDPPVRLTKRAGVRLAEARDSHLHTVHPGGTVVTRVAADIRWWTWAGHRANATLAASLPTVVTPHRRLNDRWIRLRDDLTPEGWRAAVADAASGLCLPEVDGQAVRGLKFGEALPPRLAEATLAARGGDDMGAGKVLEDPVRFVSLSGE